MSEPENVLETLANEAIEHEPTIREEIIENLTGETASEGKDDTATTTDSVSNGGGNGVGNGPGDSTDLFGIPARNTSNTGTVPPQSTETFNPAFHESNPDGSPRVTKDGKFRKKRGRKSGIPNASDSSVHNAGNIPPIGAVIPDYSKIAGFCCNLFFSGTTNFLGKHWEPTQREVADIHTATTRVMETYNIQDIPPGIALCLAVGIYAMPRINHPDTKAGFSNILQSLGIRKAPPSGYHTAPAANPSNAETSPQTTGQSTGIGVSGVGGNGNGTYSGLRMGQ